MLLLHIILVPAAGAANKIMPLGDSITQGIKSGVADEAFQVSYRKTLHDDLEAAGYTENHGPQRRKCHVSHPDKAELPFRMYYGADWEGIRK